MTIHHKRLFWHNLSVPSLSFKVFYAVVSFLALWSRFLTFYIVQFRKDPKYLTKVATQVFIRLIEFLLQPLISCNFPLFLWFFFLIFSFCLLEGICLYYFQVFVVFFFCSSCVVLLSWSGSSVPSGAYLFSLFIISIARLSFQNSVSISWL